jgi:hypothetical protein
MTPGNIYAKFKDSSSIITCNLQLHAKFHIYSTMLLCNWDTPCKVKRPSSSIAHDIKHNVKNTWSMTCYDIKSRPRQLKYNQGGA